MRINSLKIAGVFVLTACGAARSPHGGFNACVPEEPCIMALRMEPNSSIHLGDEVRFVVYAHNAETIRFTLVRIPGIDTSRFIGEEVRFSIEHEWLTGALSVAQPILFERSTMAFVDPLDPDTRLEARSRVRSVRYEMRVEITGRRLDGREVIKRNMIAFDVSL